MPERLVMTRVVRGRFPGREFDIEFWQRLSDAQIAAPPGIWWPCPKPSEGPMQINSDYRDLLSGFNESGVRYLIAGGYAVMRYSEPFYTRDLDLWVEPTAEIAAKVLDALNAFAHGRTV